eukprot:g1425.t1
MPIFFSSGQPFPQGQLATQSKNWLVAVCPRLPSCSGTVSMPWEPWKWKWTRATTGWNWERWAKIESFVSLVKSTKYLTKKREALCGNGQLTPLGKTSRWG